MTGQTMDTALPLPLDLPVEDDQRETGGEGEATPPRRRRRGAIVLAILVTLLAALLLFAIWYLINRKPIAEIPLPGITSEILPHYATSFYGVNAPTGVAVNADGSRVYATQTQGGPKVVMFDGSGKVIGSITPPASTGASHIPVYIAVNPTNGDVYVSDRPAGAVYIYSADGVYRSTFDPGDTLKGWTPLGLAFDPKGDLFVTNLGAPAQAALEFGPDGRLLKTFAADGGMNFPNGVAVDQSGNVYVTDSNNGRLLVFDSAGTQIGTVKRGSAAGELGLPRGMAIDDNGRVYVADVSGQSIMLYHSIASGSTAPKYIGQVGTAGSDDGAFAFPNAVAVDGRGRMYVADWRNNRIQLWSY